MMHLILDWFSRNRSILVSLCSLLHMLLILFVYKSLLWNRFQTVFNKMHLPISSFFWWERQRVETSLTSRQCFRENFVRSQPNMVFLAQAKAQGRSTRGNIGPSQRWGTFRETQDDVSRKYRVILNWCKQERINQIGKNKINLFQPYLI